MSQSLRAKAIRLAASLPPGKDRSALLQVLANDKTAGPADELLFLAEKVRPLVQANNMNAALLLLAQALGARREIQVMQKVSEIANLYNHTPQSLIDFRRVYVMDKLLKQAKRHMSDEDWKELRGSF